MSYNFEVKVLKKACINQREVGDKTSLKLYQNTIFTAALKNIDTNAQYIITVFTNTYSNIQQKYN